MFSATFKHIKFVYDDKPRWCKKALFEGSRPKKFRSMTWASWVAPVSGQGKKGCEARVACSLLGERGLSRGCLTWLQNQLAAFESQSFIVNVFRFLKDGKHVG